MSATANKLAAAVLAGAATGARSFTALGVMAVTARSGASNQPDRLLAKPGVKGGLALIAAQEWVMDKLPQTPSRLEPLGLASRTVGAAGAGVVIARREPERSDGSGLPADDLYPVAGPHDDSRTAVAAAAVAVAAFAATAWLGVRWRAWCADAVGRDWVGAVLEDGVSLGLSLTAARLATAP